MSDVSLVWLRDDLRLTDNPALHAAIERGGPVVVAYLHDEESDGVRAIGGAARWWLHHSLTALAADLEKRGSYLVLRRGAAASEIPRLAKETGATAVLWNRRYGATREIDAALKTSLRDDGLEVQSFHANLLNEPWTVTTADGRPFRVFTPFYKACLAKGEPRHPFDAPKTVDGPTAPDSDALADWQLLPTGFDWTAGLHETWEPGEAAAIRQLEEFAENDIEDYSAHRDEPGVDATSRLSPRLRWGELSPFQIWDTVTRVATSPAGRKNGSSFLREVVWRDFNYNILFHQTDLATKNFRPEFDEFPWEEPDPEQLTAWQTGHTGIPLVDAGMRELWHTGVMHNRIRMVTASFLIKNMLIDWRIGEQWFWDCLVDADEANNPANWQWVAGSGADAAPYFRIFNPVLQADKFDKHRDYQRRWVPELDTPEYPEPIVDLKASRREALDAYEAVKREADRRRQ
ncbi:cryptochrome/photolyase family protein [Marisediminicola senii]|uniref:cryptochrome/photolyase family protein n=1 Tax=Marisediminicola senii TaxID=2711233 RepID=UPI0013EAA276|nr:deoxyribodipyrimidine photo-lyase [Marisediminicola senii]